ncbi:MAG: metallophosphoesterase [Pseudomonadota bacterium]
MIALGDMPYGPPEEVYPPYETLIDEINARTPELVIHVGDTKSGRDDCTDQLLLEQLSYLQSFEAPVLYTPGDNEWTDCHRGPEEWSNPLDRLSFIREMYFSAPEQSFGGAPVTLEHQGEAGYPENARYQSRGIGFITAHVVGSNNNFESRGLENVEEYFARSLASSEWLLQSFKAFGDLEAIVVAIHADMFEFDFNEFGRERWLRHSGFREFGNTLKDLAQSYGKPILLIFGDSHKHVIFRPFPNDAPNVLAMEVYGARDMHAVEIVISPGAAEPFSFATVWNPALQ